jgi:hypothetical protein
VHDPRIGRRNQAEALGCGRIVRERESVRFPRARPHDDRNDDGKLVMLVCASCRHANRGGGGTLTAASYEPHPNVRHVERHRFAPPRRKTARATSYR